MPEPVCDPILDALPRYCPSLARHSDTAPSCGSKNNNGKEGGGGSSTDHDGCDNAEKKYNRGTGGDDEGTAATTHPRV